MLHLNRNSVLNNLASRASS